MGIICSLYMAYIFLRIISTSVASSFLKVKKSFLFLLSTIGLFTTDHTVLTGLRVKAAASFPTPNFEKPQPHQEGLCKRQRLLFLYQLIKHHAHNYHDPLIHLAYCFLPTDETFLDNTFYWQQITSCLNQYNHLTEF